MLPTRKYNLVGKTIISLKESAAILPLQVPITFHWFNNKKRKENSFLLDCGWEDGSENGNKWFCYCNIVSSGGQFMDVHYIIENKL